MVTDSGKKAAAAYVIIASHFPCYDGFGLYFTRIYPEKSYVLGIKIKEQFPEGMFITAEEPGRSLRSQSCEDGELVLVGGEHHKTGQGNSTTTHYEKNTIVYKTFDMDRMGVWPAYTGPDSKKYDDGTYENMFGVRMRDVNYGKGVYSEAVGFPLANAESIKEIEQHPWPSADWYNYTGIIEPLRQNPDYPFTIGYMALGWWSWEMRGMSLFFEDLLMNTEIAEVIIEKISDYGYEYFKRIIETGREYIGKNFVLIHLADDWATQESLMISPRLYRDFFKKHYRRVIDMAHSAGLKVEFHMCGSAVGLIPELIDTGIDILNPVQTSARDMTPHILKEKFGKDIAFSGGVDVQTILPFGTPDKVKDEVKYLLDTMGRDGGYILEPSHAIQVGTPPENVMAMYQAAYEYYGMKMDI